MTACAPSAGGAGEGSSGSCQVAYFSATQVVTCVYTGPMPFDKRHASKAGTHLLSHRTQNKQKRNMLLVMSSGIHGIHMYMYTVMITCRSSHL